MPLFLISLKAGGTGLNLTAADTVIHYDPWWNPAVEDQATDRAHRIGQDKPVFVYKLVAQGTVEERMLELQQRKKALAAGIYEAGGNAAAGARCGRYRAPLRAARLRSSPARNYTVGKPRKHSPVSKKGNSAERRRVSAAICHCSAPCGAEGKATKFRRHRIGSSAVSGT